MNEFEKIFQEHQYKLKNLKHYNKKIIICISGVAGAGKSTLAAEIERKFAGVRVSNDDIRHIIDQLSLAKSSDLKQQLLQDYLAQYLMPRLSKEANGLIILDSSIDRKYDEVREVSERLGYNLFVIALKVPKDEIMSRIKNRDKSKHNYQDYFDNLDRWFDDNRVFLDRVTPDFAIDNTDYRQWPELFGVIQERLQ